VGIAGGRHQGVLFRKGRLIRKVPEKDMAKVLIEEVRKIAGERETEEQSRKHEGTKTRKKRGL
jgi:(E)-4-hydroxy-3-methylbut-2-enyl-diphosphate synthase